MPTKTFSPSLEGPAPPTPPSRKPGAAAAPPPQEPQPQRHTEGDDREGGEEGEEPVLRLLRRLMIAGRGAGAHPPASSPRTPAGTTDPHPPKPSPSPSTPTPTAPPPTPASPTEDTFASPTAERSSPRSVSGREILAVVEGAGDRQAAARVAGLLKLRAHLRGRAALLRQGEEGADEAALAEVLEDVEKTEREIRGVIKDLARRMSATPTKHSQPPPSRLDFGASPLPLRAVGDLSAITPNKADAPGPALKELLRGWPSE